MNSLVPLFMFASLIVQTTTQQEKLDELFIKEDQINYNGYAVTRSFVKWREPPFGDSRTTIRRGSKELARVNGCCFRESTRFALLPLLGGDGKQLLVEAYSGGGHCCTSYHIYDLTDRFRMLFDGDDYTADDVGYEMRMVDIDKDGVYEFVQNVMNFDYFWTGHAGSIFPEVVFAYDSAAGEYLPANRKFASYLLQDISDKERIVERLNENNASLTRVIDGRGSEKTLADLRFRVSYFHAVVDVMLTYVYAGKREEGWSFFEKNYRLRDKEELRTNLGARLKTSQIYTFIYRRNPP
jgi:hypothetical protein